MSAAAPVARMLAYLANGLLPGAGLVAAGRLAAGLPLVVAAMCVAALVAAAGVVVGAESAGWFRAQLALAWLALAMVGALAQWRYVRRAVIDEPEVRRLHGIAAAAYLNDRHDEAEAAARRLTVVAPEEAGAWRLLGMVLSARGSDAAATTAEQRARSIERRHAGGRL